MTIHGIQILLLGALAMLVSIFIQMLMYKVSLWKSLPVTFLLTVFGTLGTYIWFFIENFWFGGRSYYGAVFFVPVVFLLVSTFLKIPYGYLMDFCAPAECIMLAIMKYQCLMDGCCNGRLLYIDHSGVEIYFPSQIVELIVAVILFGVLLFLSHKKERRGFIYPWHRNT